MKTVYLEEIALNGKEGKGVSTPGRGSQPFSPLRQIIYRCSTLSSRCCGVGLLSVILACATLMAQAQTIPQRQAPGPEVTIATDPSFVRFATLEGTPVTRLKVYTQAGEQIFDSGVIVSPALEWPLQDQQGQPVATGRYVYHLTSKDQAGASWMQQGQLMVNRASDNDSVGIVGDNPFGGDAPIILQTTVRRSEVRTSIQAGDEELGFGAGRTGDSKLAVTSSAASQVTYRVTIQTGAIDDAGTDANVYIQLINARINGASTPLWVLDNPNRNDFERGQVDVFNITSPDLGNLSYIYIGHDNAGNKPGWYVSWITVQNMYTGQQWNFPVCRWFADEYVYLWRWVPVPTGYCGRYVNLFPNQYPNCALCY